MSVSVGKESGKRIGGEMEADPVSGASCRSPLRDGTSLCHGRTFRSDLRRGDRETLRQEDGHCLETGDNDSLGESVSGVCRAERAVLEAPSVIEEAYDMLGVTNDGDAIVGRALRDSDKRR